MGKLTLQDRELIKVVTHIIKKRYKPNWHQIGAALRTQAGNIFAAVHIDATVRRVAV